ncbi:MAG: hypothetical protein M3Z75_11710 [Actinomycetota bacterium]|nr:hypothetical protein [Actinomycetota bacterium]
MTGNAFDQSLTGFRRWADTTERKLSGDPETDAAELNTVFDLMPDYLEIAAPSRLAAGDLTQLLLDVYPRKVTVFNREDTADTIPAVRDLIAYLADTGAITPATAQTLERELDQIEPDFADEVLSPANWGPATAMVHAMHRDGTDLSDKAAVDRWIAEQNAGLLAGHEFADDEADSPTWDGTDLKEAFGIPDVLAPVRLPDEAALTALASTAPLLTDLRDLAREVRGTTVRTPDVDPLLVGLAVETELVEQDGDTLVPGDDVEWLDDLAGDVAALEAWDYTFAQVLDTTLEAADLTEPHVGEDLDLTGHGIAMVTTLFLGGRAGVPVAELSASLKSAAVAEFSPDVAERQWEEWVGAHGDPARLLLGQLAKLSAVTVADEVARLGPLALFAVGAKLRACDVHVPELPPPDEMTADDVVLVSMFGTEEDFEAELASWLAKRTSEDAARELLVFAAGESAAVRTAAIAVVSRLGAAAEPAWREALDRPELRCYAKPALLAQLADRDPGSAVPAELKPATEDLAWLVADTFGPLTRLDHGNGTFPFDMTKLPDAGWAVSHEAIFEAMARLEHPDAEAVLTMLGKHSDDKKTAKAARRAAYKAASRRASRRSM